MAVDEKAQLAEVEQSLRKLNLQIRERMTVFQPPEQTAELGWRL